MLWVGADLKRFETNPSIQPYKSPGHVWWRSLSDAASSENQASSDLGTTDEVRTTHGRSGSVLESRSEIESIYYRTTGAIQEQDISDSNATICGLSFQMVPSLCLR